MTTLIVVEDITDQIRDYILDKHSHDKLSNSMQFIDENNLRIILKKIDGLKWIVSINTDLEASDINMPHFEISKGIFLGDPLSMGISTESESTLFLKKGLARLMIACMCLELIKGEKISSKTPLFIDLDESDGFWDKIGMRSNRYSDKDIPERYSDTNYNYGYGYDKVISFSDLCKFALGKSGGKSRSRNRPEDILALGSLKKKQKRSQSVKKFIKKQKKTKKN